MRSGHRTMIGVPRLIAILLVLLTACGEDPSPPMTTTDDLLLTCVGPPFSPEVFDREANAEEGRSAEGEALRAVIRGPLLTGRSSGAGWRELGRSSDQVAYGRGDPPVLAGYVVLRRDGNEWRYHGSGSSCVVRPYRAGRTMARWGLDPNGAEVTPETTRIAVIVNDSVCAGGVGPEERLDDPTVDVTAETITITFTSKPPTGNRTCPSHPPARRTVDLPEPLGGRQLRDGGIFPPQPPCRIEGGDCANDRTEFLGSH